MLLSGVFRRETASGFYPCGKVDSPRERVAEGLCGWRHGNSFPMTKAHSRTAKCEAFHFAPRLFFMFLFLIPFTIRQHCIIHPPANFPLNQKKQPGLLPRLLGKNYSDVGLLQFGEGCCDACSGFHNVFIAGGVTHANVAWTRECVAAHSCHVRLVEQVH